MTTISQLGSSQASQALTNFQSREFKRENETVTFSKQPLHDQLIDVYLECSPSNLTTDAKLVVLKTLAIAKRFVEALPLDYRTPIITGEPDGHIDLEWYVHTRRILTVSIDSNGILYWAALIGSEDPRGSCPFYNEIPETLRYWIGRVCGQ